MLQALRESSEAAAVEELKETSDVKPMKPMRDIGNQMFLSILSNLWNCQKIFIFGWILPQSPAFASEIMKYQWPDQNSQSK